MQNLRIIKHQDVSEDETLEICNIKSVFGSYSSESQKAWMSNNLKKDDIHFLLYENDELIAYLNLIEISISINRELIHAYGIGNVCSKSKGRGYGNGIMKKLNHFLCLQNKVGYLFCKEKLVSFYEKYDWVIIENEKSKILLERDIKSMLFNFNDGIEHCDYEGKLF